MLTIQFHDLSAILLDWVDGSYGDGGFWYLRMVGEEPTVNAIWSRLSAKEYREKRYESGVKVVVPGRQYPDTIAAQKGVYKTLRARLPNGLIDLTMIHPRLTVSEDNEQGFFLLTYEGGTPDGFFARLNRCLSIPLKEAWTDWLWVEGQKQQSRLTIETKNDRQEGQNIETEQLVQTQQTPIHPYQSQGQVTCYRVRTAGLYKEAWLHIIREQLGLGIPLYPAHIGPVQGYEEALWSIHPRSTERWILEYGDEERLSAPSLEFLLAKARQELGRHFLIRDGHHA